MSNAKHTPGAWRTTSYVPGHDEQGEPFEEQYAIRTDGEDVCSGIQVYADARLIAVAPDLLAFAAAVVEWHAQTGDPTLNDLLPAARAAIAKATGAAE